MSGKDTPQNVIRKFEKRQKTMPFLLGGLAGILVIVGIIIIITVASGNSTPFSGWFATKTPTVTATFTPTATQPSATPSMTPTITETPTPESTATPSTAYQYTVLEGDNCYTIALNHGQVDLLYMQIINGFTDPNNPCPISPGDTIWIPAPGQKMPTPTRVPSDVARATRYVYTIQDGDTLASIAEYFNSTVEDILTQNPGIKDQNAINVGDKINVRANLVTPTPTLRPTSTLVNPIAPTATP